MPLVLAEHFVIFLDYLAKTQDRIVLTEAVAILVCVKRGSDELSISFFKTNDQFLCELIAIAAKVSDVKLSLWQGLGPRGQKIRDFLDA
jgi:hypothetical protein